ncbi:general substrate transporter [Cyathus striatus]|nr:general substrate transporter [Cyathus striatus]
MTACGVFLIGSLFQCAAVELWHLFLGRAIGGVGVGALSMLAPLYMAEIAPPEVRGSLLALEQLSIVLGVVLGFWAGFGTREFQGSPSWRIPLALQLIPGLILLLGALFLPPSPRLLVLQNRAEEALRSLGILRGGRGSGVLVQIELLEMKVEAELIRRTAGVDTKGGIREELKAWKALFGKRWRGRTGVGVLVMVFQQWSGINALLYYGPTLVRSVGLKGDNVSLLVSGGIGVVQFVAVGPAIMYIDRLGRKTLLRVGSTIMALSHLCIALLVFFFQDDWGAYPGAAWGAVCGIYIFTLAYGMSFGPIGWVLPSEVFPLSMRSRGVALSTASNWFNNFLIGLITPLLISLSPTLTFTIFATACLLAYIWATYYVPETAGVSLEEMDEVFGGGVGREERSVKALVEEEIGLSGLIRELREE